VLPTKFELNLFAIWKSFVTQIWPCDFILDPCCETYKSFFQVPLSILLSRCKHDKMDKKIFFFVFILYFAYEKTKIISNWVEV
jgi:hypothetical protein